MGSERQKLVSLCRGHVKGFTMADRSSTAGDVAGGLRAPRGGRMQRDRADGHKERRGTSSVVAVAAMVGQPRDGDQEPDVGGGGARGRARDRCSISEEVIGPGLRQILCRAEEPVHGNCKGTKEEAGEIQDMQD